MKRHSLRVLWLLGSLGVMFCLPNAARAESDVLFAYVEENGVLAQVFLYSPALSTDGTGFHLILSDGSDLGVVVMGTPDADPIAMGSPDADPILMGAPDTDPLLLKPAPWRRFAAGSGSNDRSDWQTRARRRAEGVPRSR